MSEYIDDHETAPLAPNSVRATSGKPARPSRPRPPAPPSGAGRGGHKPAPGSTAPDWERFGLKGDTTASSASTVAPDVKPVKAQDTPAAVAAAQKEVQAESNQQAQQQQQPPHQSHDADAEQATFDRRHLDAVTSYSTGGGPVGENNELFNEHQSPDSKPWWKANFFVSEPVLFGTWDGVFTSCMINIFGVLIFLRTGWMVGNAGLGLSVLIILLTAAVALIAVLSAVGVCERCHMSSGGVYFLLAHVLGGSVGATVGVVYCFGQAVACSLSMVGFGESISALFNLDNIWISRGIAVGVLLLLLGINVAGVKWVIRLQLILLFVLFVAVLDFAVGSFVHTDIPHGFVGYSGEVMRNNSQSDYLPGESFFTVFGVFFPTATGVFAGINMSGDLKNPVKSIPAGTLSAVGVSTFLYLIFALILGTTCWRSTLQTDYLIAEKVSIVGVLFLAGLYVSSVSSGMGGLYGAPRILQSIAADGTIPVFRVLSAGRGPNKLPIPALCAIAAIALLFIFIGDVNTLGPVVTMPFMLTYAAVDYAYFILAMSFDWRRKHPSQYLHDGIDSDVNYGTVDGRTGLFDSSRDNTAALSDREIDVSESTRMVPDSDSSAAHKSSSQAGNTDIAMKPRSWYSIICNRWLSLIGAVLSVAAMFCINWIYALVSFLVLILIYIYINIANPGVSPGIAEFSVWRFVRDVFRKCYRRGPLLPEQVIVTSKAPSLHTEQAQLTEDNEDYASRGRYHQSEVVKGKNFDDDSYTGN